MSDASPVALAAGLPVLPADPEWASALTSVLCDAMGFSLADPAVRSGLCIALDSLLSGDSNVSSWDVTGAMLDGTLVLLPSS